MNRTRQTKRNIVSSIIQNTISILISLISRIIFVRVLDASYLGINGLFSNVLSILSLADLGMATVLMYHLYTPIAEGNTQEIKSLIYYFKRIYNYIALAVLIIGLALIPFLKYIINLSEEIPNIYIFYLVSLLNIVVSYLFVYRTTLVAADQKTYILNNYIILFKIITFVLQTGVLFLFKDYLLYLIVALGTGFLCNLAQNRATLRMYPYLRDDGVKPYVDKEWKKQIFKNIKALFLYKIAGTIQSNTDNILISVFVGTIQVGYYSNYILVLNQIVSFIGIIFNSAKASVGNLFATANQDERAKFQLFKCCELVDYILVGITTISTVVLSKDIIGLLFGQEYVLPQYIVIAIAANFYTNNIRQSIWMFRETSGLFQPLRYVTVVTAALNIVLSIILGKYFGMFGIIVATVISRMSFAWWREPMVLYKRIFNQSSREYFFTYIGRVLLTIGLVFLCTEISSLIVSGNVVLDVILKSAITIGICSFIYFLIYRRTSEFQYLLSRFVKK